jgi:DNA-3-methyladenine glycosylase
MLPASFYLRDDVVQIARDLLGKRLMTCFNGVATGGIITETESYRGPEDRASHAYNNRRTARTDVMFQPGGVAYVYLCYGIHYLLNVVTHREGIPHAVLIRALLPTHGVEEMGNRRGKKRPLSNGPGALTQALGITKHQNGHPFNCAPLWIEEESMKVKESDILSAPRVGVDYAGEDALLPWRFILAIPNKMKQNKTV